ncbi:MAG: hypothetical protein DCF15_08960 [Phormidesmis priestleyi]|uniref:Uncharacterized protein n=1 Tax=Phormidesmis priestleyi TaxID=268141 RepID=A0A2W4XGC3_9CYAN|nr:MAG: hypothetical protein DCF15_08960 [Phormidesmis priestleyi]
MAIAVLIGSTNFGSANFEPTRWDHWLLVSCFVAMAIWSVWLSWRWESQTQKMRQRARMARLVAMEYYRRDRRDGSSRGMTGRTSCDQVNGLSARKPIEPLSFVDIKRRS